MSALLFDDAEIISRYTRAQAIEDGILVDMTAEPFGDLAREAGLKWPIAMTATAFNEFVAVDKDAKGSRRPGCERALVGCRVHVPRTRREVSPLEARWKLVVQDPDGRMRG
jgi:hypothetical protein